MNTDHRRAIKSLLKDLQDRCPETTTCGKIAQCLEKDSWQEIVECCNLRLQSLRESPDLYSQGVQHTLLGALYHALQDPAQMEYHYEQAIQVFTICEGSAAGITLMYLGQCYESCLELDKATQAYQRSADFLSSAEDVLLKKVRALQSALGQRIQQIATEARNARSAGEHAQSQGNWEEARQAYEKSESLFRQIGDNVAVQQLQTQIQEVLRQEQRARAAASAEGKRGKAYPTTVTLPLFPIVGRIPAGSLREAIELNLGHALADEVWIEGKRYRLEPLGDRANSTLQWQHWNNYFMLQVRGESMEEANIRDGDYLILEKREDAADRAIVAILVDGQVTLKRLFCKPDHLFLKPENPTQIPIVVIENAALKESIHQSYAEQNMPIEIRIATEVKLLAQALFVCKLIT